MKNHITFLNYSFLLIAQYLYAQQTNSVDYTDDRYKIWQAIILNYQEYEVVGPTEIFKEKAIPFHLYVPTQKKEDKRKIKAIEKE